MKVIVPAGREPVLVFSPHLDDGVMSCGDLLYNHPASTVATVFAAAQPSWDRLTTWDKACDFKRGEDVVAARRAEDNAACACLYASALHMDFTEVQYKRGQRTHPYMTPEICAELLSLARRVGHTDVYFPMGLVHSDHKRVHNASICAYPILRADGFRVHWYEDALYRRMKGALAGRLDTFARAARYPRQEGIPKPVGCPDKIRAMQCYASQFKGLRTQLKNFTNFPPGWTPEMILQDTLQPEGYWSLGA